MSDRQAVHFEVRYPWGQSYCDQLRAHFDRMGFATTDHPLLDGDSVGFLFAKSRDELAAGMTLIERVSLDMDGMNDEAWWEMFLDLVAQLTVMSVYVVEYDWKHLDWTAGSYEDLGIDLKLVSENVVDGERRYLFEISRPPGHR